MKFVEVLERYLAARDELRHASARTGPGYASHVADRDTEEKKAALEAAAAQLNDYMWRLEP